MNAASMKLAFPALVLLGALILGRLTKWLFSRRAKALDPATQVWRHALWSSLQLPLRLLIWFAALSIIQGQWLHFNKHPELTRYTDLVVDVGIICLLSWAALSLSHQLQRNYASHAQQHEQDIDHTMLDAIGKLLAILIFSVALLAILQALGVSITALMAFGGAAGIAVGFAAQTLVANLLGGLTIFASDIFKIGETVILEDQSLRGDVEAIGWRATRVRGWDGKCYFVPNAVFNTSTVVNHTRMAHRTIAELVYLRYQDLARVRAVVDRGNELLAQRSDIGYYVLRFDSFGTQALQLRLYAFALTQAYADYMQIKEELLLAIADIALDEGCELVLPASNLYWRSDATTAPVLQRQSEA